MTVMRSREDEATSWILVVPPSSIIFNLLALSNQKEARERRTKLGSQPAVERRENTAAFCAHQLRLSL